MSEDKPPQEKQKLRHHRWQIWRKKPKKKELTAEKRRVADTAEFNKDKVKFHGHCDDARPLWDQEVEAALAAAREAWKRDAAEAEEHGQAFTEPWPTRTAIEKWFTENAIKDVEHLEVELDRMQVRSALLLTILTVLFAIYTIRPGNLDSTGGVVGLIFLAIALAINSMAFAWAISPLAPPLRRAWKPYNKRRHQTLLMSDYFTKWVYYCWIGERRTPVIQQYKKAHAAVVRLLIVAAVAAIPGVVLGIIFR